MHQAHQGKSLVMPISRRESPDDSRADVSCNERKARWFVVATILGALGMFWAGTTLSQREETAGIRSLPSAERQSLYARTLEELSTICRDGAASGGELRDHCVAQARFVLELPECDDACQRAAA